MFKVICIDASECRSNDLKEGEVYTVYKEDDIRFNLPVYFLCEIKIDGLETPYVKKRFIPLSNIDELELVNEKEEIVCLR